jgi:hypothetical protein
MGMNDTSKSLAISLFDVSAFFLKAKAAKKLIIIFHLMI